MSQETQRQDQDQPIDYAPPAQEPKKNNNNRIYLAIIVLLIISNIYFIVSRNKVAEQRDVARSEFASSDSSRVAVESDYNAALIRLDELMSKNASMDSMLMDKNSEVAKLRKQIDAIIKNKNATAAELGKAKRLIEQLNSKVNNYEERIAALESANDVLTTERDVLSSEKDELIRVGSVLHASNIRMKPIDIKRGGKKIKETEKARRVDVMRIMFDIDENRIAETGVKELFLRITGPDGNLLSNAAYGSGVTELSDGATLNYTLSKLIELQKAQPVNDVIVDWNQDSDYREGDYHIEIFNEGYKIGSGRVTLR